MTQYDPLKRAAAESAARLVRNGMVVGLGTGSTAAFVVEVLGRHVREGLQIKCVPTSERTATQARALGIPLLDLQKDLEIDLTIDGADEVEDASLNLVKGLGGALLREKIVASMSRRLVIVVDESKIVSRLGSHHPIPAEVVPFCWQATARRLANMSATTALRKSLDGKPFRTDGGNYILDCTFEELKSPPILADQLDHVVGLAEHGLFIGLTSEVHVAGAAGVRVIS